MTAWSKHIGRVALGSLALGLAGCAGAGIKPLDVGTAYHERARVMPIGDAVLDLKEVLETARGDNPNRRDDPLERITVTEDFLDVVAVCYDEEGHLVGRTPYKRNYILLEPHAYAVDLEGQPTVYFVKLSGDYRIPAYGTWSDYPNLQSECLWFRREEDVVALFETVTCLKLRSSLE